ncbi:hypothetical protein BS17DRAFT_710929 [Gyrodon lividus]|nr:hypothetical protein BS17DRAFT_710929 [Gyrodon lividus]
MALTATSQSALAPWDETIVPALRKRLESESRILAKRMSVASISSIDDSPRSNAPSNSGHSSRDHTVSPYHTVEPRKSSAIPRPSLQYPRTTQDHRSDASANNIRVNGASSSSALPFKRARTYSQPYAYDASSPNAYSNGNHLPTPDSSRPTSPRMSDVKPTRIPVAARGRTISTSSHAHSIAPRAESRNGILPQSNQAPTPDASLDLWVVNESDAPQPMTPQMVSIRHQASNIMNEPAPFVTSSIASSTRSRGQQPAYQDSRPSNDSEERPFEHWYRGDIHRNGGVGELRVARHMEMLQIANYGHNLRKPVRTQTRDVSGPMDYSRRRKRADSVGTGRESLYLDDDHTRDVDMVLDESPLTDIEADPDTDPEVFYDAYAGTDADNTIQSSFNLSMSGQPLASTANTRSKTPTNPYPAPGNDTTPKHVPVTRAASEPLSSSTPSGPPRTSAETMMPTPPSSGSRPRSLSRTISPTSQSSHQSQTKRRAKSPVASSASTPKKAKTKTPHPASRREDMRGSVATYPTPEGDVVDAIPTWTQPVQKSSNWDEASGVVLPVVARKKGLDGQYEQADGSPRSKPPEQTPIKPAPGTFGYDYTKYRAPRGDEEIPMNEFGQFPERPPHLEKSLQDDTPPEPIPLPTEPEEPIWPDSRRMRPRPPNSPALFSQYRANQVPTISVTRPSTELEYRLEAEEEGVSGGCCKCVVM